MRIDQSVTANVEVISLSGGVGAKRAFSQPIIWQARVNPLRKAFQDGTYRRTSHDIAAALLHDALAFQSGIKILVLRL
jgi:hypothetical protein